MGLQSRASSALPDEKLDDPALEERAREISKGLRCMVCQNQSIDDSNADLARDLRLLVRDRLQAGDTDEEVKAYIVDRYGAFVLLKPPFDASTLVLWLAPPILVIVGIGAIWLGLGKRRGREGDSGNEALSADEQARIDRLLGSKSDP